MGERLVVGNCLLCQDGPGEGCEIGKPCLWEVLYHPDYKCIEFDTLTYDHLYSTKLRFTSSDKNIVGVNANGTLAANAVGTAKITVEARDGSGVKFSFKVRVIEEKKAK